MHDLVELEHRGSELLLEVAEEERGGGGGEPAHPHAGSLGLAHAGVTEGCAALAQLFIH